MMRKSRKEKRVLFLCFPLILASILLFTLPPVSGREARTVRVAMGYIPNVQFAPWYVAEAKGYFAGEGLKVEFDYNLDVDGLLLLGQGKREFAVGGGDMVIIARSQGLPVTYVCTLYAKFPPSIISLAEKGITTMADLRGKRIGVPFMGTSYIALRAMLAKAGMKEEDVKVLMIGYTQIPSLLADKVDAAVVFANNEPIQLAAQGRRFNQIYSYDYFPLVGHGVVTSERMLEEEPTVVRAFVRATLEGMRYALRYPRAAFTLVQKAIDLPPADAEVQYQVFRASMALWENDYTRRHGLGSSDPAAWAASQQFMLDNGFIKNATDVGKLVRNDFLR
ncbi:MAG: ABC transporter substrate-binding protein [Firmicutes bacterium]|nr:ABC transporter substrate-binding protein [Bacillota bacterium]